MPASVDELCQQHQLTLADLVARTGLDENRIAAIILGRWTPTPAERQKIAAVFQTQVSEITWGHKTPIQRIYGQGPG
ncbi:MAG: helix-turn-helix transcriptional regulator [Planctomycetes bacterium]|nr:helix-turn-helix transcriptional regulator [Planctomycetota bacterium]